MTAPELRVPTGEVEDLVVAFGDLCAVDGVSFSVGRGEVFGLLGSVPTAPARPPRCA
ncbi:MAG TPA: hypothetical protein VND98_06785 [Solirubrobacterales bacterium]|nr:hypothetical protein [Solirubrobacterales bacterium]